MTRLIVCCGVGGAGKTTVSAALAAGAAIRGDRVVVLTIDPARRLADALGVALGNDPRPVQLEASGTLDAVMLDRKATFDALVKRFAPDVETAHRLLTNPYYAAASTRLGGSHEYMATEKLAQLVESERWDLVVVDTPPAQHAIDFLKAPERVVRLFERGAVQAITERERTGLFGFAARSAMKVVERVAGDTVLDDAAEFLRLLSHLSSALKERNRAVRELLHSDRTSYYLVTHPIEVARDDIADFAGSLHEEGLRLDGLIVNRRVMAPGPVDEPPASLTSEWQAALRELPRTVDALARRQEAAVASLLQVLSSGPQLPVWSLPDVPGGVRTIDGLVGLAQHLPPLA